MMNRRAVFAAACLAMIFAMVPGKVLAHTHLEKANPSDGSSMAWAPQSVRLWFSGKVSADWSKIEVTDADAERVDSGVVRGDADDPTLVEVDLEPLQAGTYHVNWNVVSGDGHRVKGAYTFTVQ